MIYFSTGSNLAIVAETEVVRRQEPVSPARLLTIARAEIGNAAVPGQQHNARIQEYLRSAGYGQDDETSWCAAFVNWVVQRAGGVGPPGRGQAARSRVWLTWGSPIASPVLGCVCITTRPGGAHVGFVDSWTRTGGTFGLLGGNQGRREVKVSRFRKSSVLGFRIPC